MKGLCQLLVCSDDVKLLGESIYAVKKKTEPFLEGGLSRIKC
jgi:hypothetical protein